MPTATPFNNLITFSRGSNATVTGSNGLIQWAPNNLLLQSESFDATAWTKVLSASATANTDAAPDGTITADTVIAGATNSAVRQTVTTQADSYTFSCWIKRKTGTGNVEISATGGLWVTQSLTTSWQRFSVTQSLSAGSNFPGVRITTSGDEVYLWGAQLELGSTATAYNPTTVKNLLGFSEAFDNAAWTKSNSSIVTGAQANPVNGAFNAQKMMENTAAGNHRVAQGFTSLTGATYTFSCYAKAAERTWIYLYDDMANGYAFFNLANGTVGTVAAGWTSTSITSVGNGWYRISGTTTEAAGGVGGQLIGIASANNTPSYTGDGNSGVYIYGAQLSDSASLDPYVPTPGAAPSSTAFYGPRFDFDPVTLQPRGLLVEEQRTNLLLYSEDFTNAVWIKAGATISANATASPDGATTADRLIEDTSSGGHYVSYQSAAVTSGTAYTISAYVKANGRTWVRVAFATGFTASNTWFDLANGVVGTVGATSASITNVGNGWYRITATQSATSTTTSNLFITMETSGSGTSYTGNGVSGIFIWGAQLEAGAFATSYIPTVASTVTRSADVATITGQNFAQWYGQTEGSFVASVGLLASFNFPVPFMAADSAAATTKRIQIYLSGTAPTYRVTDGTDQAAINTAAVAIPSTSNFATAYQANNFAATVNGAAVATDSSGTVPAVNTFYIGNQASTQFINGHIRNIRFIPARAADFQLQGLST